MSYKLTIISLISSPIGKLVVYVQWFFDQQWQLPCSFENNKCSQLLTCIFWINIYAYLISYIIMLCKQTIIWFVFYQSKIVFHNLEYYTIFYLFVLKRIKKKCINHFPIYMYKQGNFQTNMKLVLYRNSVCVWVCVLN